MSSVQTYDVVKIKELHKPIDFQRDGTSFRAPCVSDVAIVIEVYINPAGCKWSETFCRDSRRVFFDGNLLC